MQRTMEPSPIVPTPRERSRLALYRIAGTLGCRPEAIIDAARSERYPDETAELVRLWFKLASAEARSALLARARALAQRTLAQRTCA